MKVTKNQKLVLNNRFLNYKAKEDLINFLEQPQKDVEMSQAIRIKKSTMMKKIIEMFEKNAGILEVEAEDALISRLISSYEVYKRKGIPHFSEMSIRKEETKAILRIKVVLNQQ
ncbi:unnamed protein product [Paramecium octaurelia]|uniref:Uncharacterized protein n=1 Tax=Paramecium octaurelia TaxID=43137 RepID=A0A8S1U7Q7_PAROT|nr:unnamed protein product [Paramecium octaurelia]